MKSSIIAIGRWKRGPERDLFEHYAKRLSSPLELRELEERKKFPLDQLKNKEAELLLSAIPKGARVVVLDGSGKALSSVALAKRIGDWRDTGTRQIAWLIASTCHSLKPLSKDEPRWPEVPKATRCAATEGSGRPL